MGFRKIVTDEARMAAAGAATRQQLREAREARPAPRRRGPGEAKVRQVLGDEVRAIYEAHERGEQPELTGRGLVAVWARAHEQLYGVHPAPELAGQAFLGACSAANKLLAEIGPEQALEYLRYAVQREQEREAWRRREGREGRRLGWRQLFVERRQLVDYRVQVHRQAPPRDGVR